MKKALLTTVMLLGATVPVLYGQTQVIVNPDCMIPFQFTASGQVAPSGVPAAFNNKQVGCNVWQIQYANSGFSAVTLTLAAAPDNAGVPGTFGTMGGTLLFGVNPNTNTTGASTLINTYGTAFPAWVQVQLTATGSGQVTGVAFGVRQAGSGGASGGGGSGTNINLAQVAGVNTASDTHGGIVPGGTSVALGDGVSNTALVPQANNAGTPGQSFQTILPYVFNGTTWDRDFTCSNSVQVALSGTAYTQIVAGSGSTIIRVCKAFVTSASSGSPVVNTFNIAFGACAGTPTQIFTAAGVTGFDEDFGGALRSGAGGALCMKESTANSDPVTVTYAQF